MMNVNQRNYADVQAYVEDTSPAPERSDIIGDIITYEMGEMDNDEMIELFQRLIDSGIAWTLQGSYGRTAAALIEAGLCTEKVAA